MNLIPSLPVASLGFPRIGRQRELKFALERYWKAQLSEDELLATAQELRARHWRKQRVAGVTIVPSNDFSLYDQVLDALVLVGATPARFGTGPVTLERYFAMARNSAEQPAMEMTKWFDTNYHYLAPEWTAELRFQPDMRKPLAEIAEARALGIETRPVLIGPVTLLLLGKSADGTEPLTLLPKLVDAYTAVLKSLAEAGVEWAQIDEPCLVTNLPEGYAEAYRTAYAVLTQTPVKLMLATYFGALSENRELALSLGTAGIHIDAVRAPEQAESVAAELRAGQVLSLGCVNGRNIWQANLRQADELIQRVQNAVGRERLQLAPSCSLLHVPYDASDETELEPRELQRWLAFARQKLDELRALSQGAESAAEAFAENARRIAERAAAASVVNPAVRSVLAALNEEDFRRSGAYAERAAKQREKLGLPPLPTTTIGSFPQTAEVRQKRAAFRKGALSAAEYEAFLRAQTEDCVRRQEAIGLDVLVHGEFERNDMVEYFGELLNGFAFTRNGWVQSYGSRCVKPPIIYGDVHRPEPMTVAWSAFAQSLTVRPMKGMLTGPVTILQWSFVRDDIARKETAFQIACALREEVRDLEAAGIGVIQVDEPALREGLPLRKADWSGYLDWATRAFRLATSGVRDETQIHTHMCYGEFEDVLQAIAALDADVISMESARSQMRTLAAFRREGYPNEIGPGVWDIHSPRVPSAAEMRNLLEKALAVFRPEQVWANPDCGLKTRGWPEVTEALQNLCEAARQEREVLAVRA